MMAHGVRTQPPWRQWGETVGVTGVAVVIGYLIRPADPLFVEARFPWLLLAPLLVALRYGVLPGIGSTLLIMLFWWAGHYHAALPASAFPFHYFLGALIVVMISGQYSGNWQTRLRRVNQVNHYLDERLQALTKMHYLVLVSHDRLEQSLITRPATLREGMATLRALMSGRSGQAGLPAAAEFLAMLAQYCQFEVAGLFRWEHEKPSTTCVAEIGSAGRLVLDDPLVVRGLESCKVNHVGSVPLENGTVSKYLAVAPLVASDKTTLGVVAVRQMPFFALNDETLQMLAVLVGYYADSVVAGRRAVEIRAAFPDCPLEFANEITKLARCKREVGIESVLVALVVPPHSEREELVGHLRRLHRGLDLVWERTMGTDHVFLILMPLSGLAAAEVFLYRVEETVIRHFGHDLDGLRIRRHVTRVSASDPQGMLTELLAHAS